MTVRNGIKDRTGDALAKQLAALVTRLFEIGVLHSITGRMTLRLWPVHKVLDCIPWLRYQNAQGCHIFLRPFGPVGIILLDDLKPKMLTRLYQDGFPPAAIIETSSGNLQAWIRLIANNKEYPLPAFLLNRAASFFSRRYHTDPAAANWRQFGRAAGFTNRKIIHQRQGLHPYALLRHASGIVAPAGRQLLVRLNRSPLKKTAIHSSLITKNSSLDPETHYNRLFNRIIRVNKNESWILSPDLSRMDFMIASHLLRQGFHPEFIEQVLLLGSPRLEQRKNGHQNNYVRRTIQKLLSLSPS